MTRTDDARNSAAPGKRKPFVGLRVIRRVYTAPILVYRHLVSPMLPRGCIYTPSCSRYAEQAVISHGMLKGTVLALARIGRCAGGLYTGGEDPVPQHLQWSEIQESYRRFRIRKGS